MCSLLSSIVYASVVSTILTSEHENNLRQQVMIVLYEGTMVLQEEHRTETNQLTRLYQSHS